MYSRPYLAHRATFPKTGMAVFPMTLGNTSSIERVVARQNP